LSQPAGNPDRWRAIDDNAGLGLPLPAGGRRRFAKRLVARACRPFLARQIAFNRDLLAEIVEIRNSLAGQIAEVRASLPSAEIAGLARELASRGEAVDHLLPVVERHGYSIEGTEEILADLARDRELMREEVELASQQSLVRLHDVVGALRAEMGDVAAQIDELDGRVGATARSVEDVAGELHSSTSQLRLRLAQVDLLLGRVRRALPETPPLEELAGLPGPFATMYGAFE
jgi:NACalpha-BTF3-like transcription factor